MVGFSEAQLLTWLLPWLWPFVRALALLQVMPVLGQRMVPTRVRIGLALFLALVVAPVTEMPGAAAVPLDSPPAWALLLQQLLVGWTLGFAVRLVFAAVEFAGEVVGLQMGLNFAGFFDPLLASQQTAASRLFGTLLSFLFVVTNGHLIVIAALAHSLRVFPPSTEPFAFVLQVQPWVWGAEIFHLGLWMALPLIGMMLLVNLVLGVIARVAPQSNIFALGFPVTLSVGLLGIMAVLPSLQQPFEVALQRALAVFTGAA